MKEIISPYEKQLTMAGEFTVNTKDLINVGGCGLIFLVQGNPQKVVKIIKMPEYSSNPKKDQQDIQQEIDALKKWLKAKELILPVEDIFSDEISYFEKVSTKELPQLDLANISDDYAMSYVLVSWSPDNIKQQRSGASVRRLKTVNNLLKNIQAAMEDQELHTLVTNILDNLPKGPHRLLSFFASSKLEDKLIEANNKHFPLDNQNKSICQIM